MSPVRIPIVLKAEGSVQVESVGKRGLRLDRISSVRLAEAVHQG